VHDAPGLEKRRVRGWLGYRDVFANRAFRRFWLGFTVSSIGDAMTRVALYWYVLQQTDSARALGLLSLVYMGPVLAGGLVAGALLDRFDRRRVMIVDNVVRGLAVASIPLADALGALTLAHVYGVAAIYGSLMMISLAGGPALLPSLVRREQLATVNALETLSFTLGGVLGPAMAGLLIAWVGAPNVLALDALSYGTYALALAGVTYLAPPAADERGTDNYRMRDAVRLLFGNPVLLSTTTMFMTFNLGQGFLFVALPIFTERTLGGGATLYGLLLGLLAAGEVISSLMAGSRTPRLPLGLLICLAQLFSGVSLVFLLMGNIWGAVLAMVLHGLCSAPLTIWAQTLRMAIIPERLRGRTFALLRTIMQGGGPLGGGLAGILLPLVGVRVMLGLAGLVAGAPGAIGLYVRALRRADSADGREDALPPDAAIAIQEAPGA
jgi:MFS family permease